MEIRKLFQVLVAGGAILAGVTTGCAGMGQNTTASGGSEANPDGGTPRGGGTAGW